MPLNEALRRVNEERARQAMERWIPREKEMAALLEAGFSVPDLAEHYAETPSVTRSAMRKLGLWTRKRRVPYNNRSKTKTYKTWIAMRARCSNKKQRAAHRYVLRGITVCERWSVYANFLADMGERPDGMTLERIDNEKGYSVDNCKWATRKEQMRNTSVNRMLEYKGRLQPMAAWAEQAGIALGTFKVRIYRGMTMHEAMTRPLGRWAG